MHKLVAWLIKREIEKDPYRWHEEIANIAYEAATDVCDITAHKRLRRQAEVLAAEFLRLKFGVTIKRRIE